MSVMHSLDDDIAELLQRATSHGTLPLNPIIWVQDLDDLATHHGCEYRQAYECLVAQAKELGIEIDLHDIDGDE